MSDGMGLLQGRRAIVTGGASGIGKATCIRMAAAGARVAVLDVDPSGAAAVAEAVGGVAVTADVGDGDALAAAFAEAAQAMGGLDTLFNNAGAGNLAPLHEYPSPEWHRLLDVNLTGVFHGLRAAIPLMLGSGGGAIVNNASVSGMHPTRGEAPYSAAKAGVLALTASAALEYGPAVRVNAVSPGLIRTPLTEFVFALDHIGAVLDRTPLRRGGTAEEVADVVVFLCSEQARFVTGHNLVVDGGLSLYSGVDDMLRALLPGPGPGSL